MRKDETTSGAFSLREWGEKIERARSRASVRQEALCHESHMSTSTYQHIKKGRL